MGEPTTARGVQKTAQAKNIIRTLKDAAEPLILISHNIRQVMGLVDRIIVFRRRRMGAGLVKRGNRRGQDVVAHITGARTGKEFMDAANSARTGA